MPLDKRVLDQLIVDAGSADAAVRALKQRAVRSQTLLSQKALAGVFQTTVTDWDTVKAFLADRAHSHEVTGFEAICQAAKDAVEEQDPEALILNLLLAFRVTTAC